MIVLLAWVILITGGSGDAAGGSFWDSSPCSQHEGFNLHKHHLGPHFLTITDYSKLHDRYEPLPEEETTCMNVNTWLSVC